MTEGIGKGRGRGQARRGRTQISDAEQKTWVTPAAQENPFPIPQLRTEVHSGRLTPSHLYTE